MRGVLAVGAVAVLAASASSAAPPKPRPGAVACEDAAGQLVDASEGRTLVLGRVAVPPPEQVIPIRKTSGSVWERSAKYGMLISAGDPVTLEVPIGARRNYALVYGRRSGRLDTRWGETSVRMEPCPPGILDLHWTGFAGGFVLNRPACVPLLVHANGQTDRVRISLGKRCP